MGKDEVTGKKVADELSSVKDAAGLHAAMADFKTLHDKESQSAFQTDLNNIQGSVDMKKLNLDGFHIIGYGDSDKGTSFIGLQKDGTTDQASIKGLDSNGQIWEPNATNHKLAPTGRSIFDAAAPAPAPTVAEKTDAPPPPGSQVAVDKTVPPTDAPAAPAVPAAATDKTFGSRQFQVDENGKAFYPASHGDTYWSVAKDLLKKSDQPDYAPSNTEIANEVKKLAALNNKTDANKLMVGEKILLPITPPAPAPEVAPAPAAPAAPAPEIDPKTGQPKAAAPEIDPATGKAKVVAAPEATAAPAAPAAVAAEVGFNMKELGANLAPENGAYKPLSPLGMSGLSVDTTQATAEKAVPPTTDKNGVTTQETNMYMNDGATWFNINPTYIKNVDTTKGDILQSRTTTYSSPHDMSFESVSAPIKLNGVTQVKTELQPDGNYKTVVTANDGDHTFSTDSKGTVQMASGVDGANQQFAVAPTSDLLASVDTSSDKPTPVAVVAPAPEVAVAPAPTPDPAEKRQDVAQADPPPGQVTMTP